MSIDVLQLLYYAGFALLGWWLRHQGVLQPPSGPAAPPAPPPVDQKGLIELLKTLLDRLAQAPAPSAPNSTVFHVPIEVAAGAKPPGTAGA
jgi:hypothetical protein